MATHSPPASPSCSETNKTSGVDLLVELWQKGLIWDNVVGYKLIQVDQLFQGQLAAVVPDTQYSNGYDAPPPPSKFHLTRWFTLDADLMVSGVDHPAIIGTKNPTPYKVLLDLRWELTSFVGGDQMAMDQLVGGGGISGGVGGGSGGVLRPYVEHSSVDNYNKIDSTYGSIMGYGSGDADAGGYGDVGLSAYNHRQGGSSGGGLGPYNGPYNNSSEMYSATAYNSSNGGYLDEDPALYGRCPIDNGYDDDGGGYLVDGGGVTSRESTFQDNNYSFYDNSYREPLLQPPPSSCDMTNKRPKLLPKLPATARDAPAMNANSQPYPGICPDLAAGEFSVSDPYDAYSDSYRTSSEWAAATAVSTVLPQPPTTVSTTYDLDNNYEVDLVTGRGSRSRRKVLPNAPREKRLPSQPPPATVPLFDEFENEPLSYNSRAPSKLDDR